MKLKETEKWMNEAKNERSKQKNWKNITTSNCSSSSSSVIVVDHCRHCSLSSLLIIVVIVARHCHRSLSSSPFPSPSLSFGCLARLMAGAGRCCWGETPHDPPHEQWLVRLDVGCLALVLAMSSLCHCRCHVTMHPICTPQAEGAHGGSRCGGGGGGCSSLSVSWHVS